MLIDGSDEVICMLEDESVVAVSAVRVMVVTEVSVWSISMSSRL